MPVVGRKIHYMNLSTLGAIAPSGIEPENSSQDCFLYGSTLTGFESHIINVYKNADTKRYRRFYAGGGTRTHTPVKTTDFESVSSASSDTPAYCFVIIQHRFLRVK